MPPDAPEGAPLLATLLAIGLAAIGGALLVAAIAVMRKRRAFLARATRTEGEVVGFKTRTSRQTGGDRRTVTTHYPIVRFTVDRREVRFEGSVGSGQPAYREGERVGVLYDPADPKGAMIDGFAEHYMLPFMLAVFGLVTGGAGVGLLLL